MSLPPEKIIEKVYEIKNKYGLKMEWYNDIVNGAQAIFLGGVYSEEIDKEVKELGGKYSQEMKGWLIPIASRSQKLK